jgi:GTP-binding protein Era
MKSAFVAIVGRPSSGKSSILNALCGHKVSIVSRVPQTTRNRIRGILNRPEGQLVFIDTPGFHQSDRKFNMHMRGLVTETIGDADLLLYVTDGTSRPGAEEAMLADQLRQSGERLVVAVNKKDLYRANADEVSEPVELETFLEEKLPGITRVETSAAEGTGLDDLVDALFARAPEEPPAYPEEFYTDQDPAFRIAEIIREKAIAGARQELPHALYVEVSDLEQGGGAGSKLWVRAFVNVERDSQKAIVVGAGGANIKRIRIEAQKELSEIFDRPVHLDLRVKTQPKWRKNEVLLRRIVT